MISGTLRYSFLAAVVLLLSVACRQTPPSVSLSPSASKAIPINKTGAADEDEPWCLPGNAADWEAYQASLEESKVEGDPDLPPPDLGEQLRKLHSPSPDDRLDAIRALGNMGPAAAAAVPDLREALKARHPTVQRDYELVGFQFKSPVLWALARIGPAAEPAVADILEIALAANPDLNPPEYDYQVLAVQALGSIGGGAKDAVGPLLKFAREFSAGDVRRYYVLRAIGQIGTQEALSGLEEFLLEDDGPTREVAARALLKGRPESLEPWFTTLAKENPKLATEVAGVLDYSLGRYNFLVDSLGTEYKSVAMKSLARLGPEASAAVPILLKMDGQVQRTRLVEAIRSLDPEGELSVPLIASDLDDPAEVADAMDLLDRLNLPRSREVLHKYVAEHPGEEQRLEHIRELHQVGDPGMQ